MKFLTESAVWDILENLVLDGCLSIHFELSHIQHSLKVLSDVSEKAFSLLYMD